MATPRYSCETFYANAVIQDWRPIYVTVAQRAVLIVATCASYHDAEQEMHIRQIWTDRIQQHSLVMCVSTIWGSMASSCRYMKKNDPEKKNEVHTDYSFHLISVRKWPLLPSNHKTSMWHLQRIPHHNPPVATIRHPNCWTPLWRICDT